MKQVHLLISGFVQGVGYREFVKSEAKKLGITGWTRNLSDQRVEVIAQGIDADLKKIIELCEKGPFLSEVKNVSVEWQEVSELFSNFEKRPTA